MISVTVRNARGRIRNGHRETSAVSGARRSAERDEYIHISEEAMDEAMENNEKAQAAAKERAQRKSGTTRAEVTSDRIQ
jgi:hypothetical protein